MDRLAQRKQADEIATRLDAGESVTDLANEYGLHRQTIWRRANQGIGARFPGMDDRDESREEITAMLWRRIETNFEKGDDKTVALLLERLTKLNGLDHTHRLQEAQLNLDAARIRLMAERMAAALEEADIPISQRRKVLELIAGTSG